MRNDRNQPPAGGERENRPVLVRNRDIPLLANVKAIAQEVQWLEHQRQWQRERMLSITHHLSFTPGGGMPKGLDEAFARLSELDEEHERKIKEYTRQLKAAEEILDQIKSRSMRSFVIMKYMTNMPNTYIRQELHMSRTDFNRARRCVESAERMATVRWQERYAVGKC